VDLATQKTHTGKNRSFARTSVAARNRGIVSPKSGAGRSSWLELTLFLPGILAKEGAYLVSRTGHHSTIIVGAFLRKFRVLTDAPLHALAILVEICRPAQLISLKNGQSSEFLSTSCNIFFMYGLRPRGNVNSVVMRMSCGAVCRIRLSKWRQASSHKHSLPATSVGSLFCTSPCLPLRRTDLRLVPLAPGACRDHGEKGQGRAVCFRDDRTVKREERSFRFRSRSQFGFHETACTHFVGFDMMDSCRKGDVGFSNPIFGINDL
jgi:hypothetical protein